MFVFRGHFLRDRLLRGRLLRNHLLEGCDPLLNAHFVETCLVNLLASVEVVESGLLNLLVASTEFVESGLVDLVGGLSRPWA